MSKLLGVSRLGNSTRKFELSMLARELAVGCDIHRDFGVFCVLQHIQGAEFDAIVREFPNTPNGNDEAIAWIKEQIKPQLRGHKLLLVIESTGPYHFLAARQFTEAGFEVIVVNPARIKNLLRAEGKNDKKDSFTLARLALSFDLEGGMQVSGLQAALRGAVRDRVKAISGRTTASNRMGNILTTAGIPLAALVQMGSVSGRAMVQALLEGERDRVILTKMWKGVRLSAEAEAAGDVLEFVRAVRRDPELSVTKRKKVLDILDVLRYVETIDEHVIESLKTQVAAWEFWDGKVAELDEQIENGVAAYREANADGEVIKAEDVVKRLMTAPSVTRMAAITMIAEFGLQFDKRYDSPGALAAMLGLAPNVALSAGKLKGNGSKGGGNNFVKPQLLQGVATFLRQTPPEGKGKLLYTWARAYQARNNAFKTRVAMARKIATAWWWMLHYEQDYDDSQYSAGNTAGVISIARSVKNRVSGLGVVTDAEAEKELVAAHNAIAAALGKRSVSRYAILARADLPLEELGLSKRCESTARKLGVTTAAQLVLQVLAGKMPGVGPALLAEIETVLTEYKFWEVLDE